MKWPARRLPLCVENMLVLRSDLTVSRCSEQFVSTDRTVGCLGRLTMVTRRDGGVGSESKRSRS